MDKKTLSVVMPNYNDADHIAISLKAICEQSFAPKEVIVVDDGSTDNSLAVIKESMNQYPCIKLLQNKTNQGVNYSVNKGAKAASGNYIYFPAANDIVYPGFFEKSMELLTEHPEAGLAFCDLRTIMVRDGSSTHDKWMSVSGYFSPQQMADMAAKHHYVFSACGANSIIKKDLLEAEVYMSDLHTWGDWILCKIIVFRHGCCYIPEPLVGVRCMEEGNLSQRVSEDQNYFQQLCIKVIQLFASPEYEDVAKLLVRSRSLKIMRPNMRTPAVVSKAISSMDTRSEYAERLAFHLLIEYYRTQFDEYLHNVSAKSKNRYRIAQQHASDLRSHTLSFTRNIFDRVYASAFDKYSRARALLRK